MRTSLRRLPGWPWILVVVAALAMGLAGTYQFVWSSLRDPVSARVVASEAAIGSVFTAFVIFQTLSQFPAGWIRDRYGPRVPMLVAAALMTIGFTGVALAQSYLLVLVSYGLGGAGAGAAYTVAINTPVKWFSKHRGLATGIVGMSFGAASFLLIPLVRGSIQDHFTATVLGLAALAGLAGLLAAIVLRDPTTGEAAPSNRDSGEEPDVEIHDEAPPGWRDAIRTWQFWLLYGIFAANNFVGLMLIGKVVTFADALGLSAAAATGAASIVAVAEAGGVLAGGAAADRFGARRTLVTGMILAGISLSGAVFAGEAGMGILFVILASATALFRSPVFSVFPALVGDYYGTAHASETYGLLYTGKLWGGLGAGAVASLMVSIIGWSATFLAGGVVLVLTGIVTLALRPVGDLT